MYFPADESNFCHPSSKHGAPKILVFRLLRPKRGQTFRHALNLALLCLPFIFVTYFISFVPFLLRLLRKKTIAKRDRLLQIETFNIMLNIQTYCNYLTTEVSFKNDHKTAYILKRTNLTFLQIIITKALIIFLLFSASPLFLSLFLRNFSSVFESPTWNRGFAYSGNRIRPQLDLRKFSITILSWDKNGIPKLGYHREWGITNLWKIPAS